MKAKHKHVPIRTLREAERWIRANAGSIYMGHNSLYRWEACVYADGAAMMAHGSSATDAVDQLVRKLEAE